MAPTHHPSAQALANFLIGDCSPGAALLLTRHVELCPRCASRVQALGAAGVAPSDHAYGPPQTLRPGLEVAYLNGASGLGEAVLQIRAAAGLPLSATEPLPLAEILVLEGRILVDGKTFRKGDFLSLDENPKKQLVSDPASGVLYLATAHDFSADSGG